MTSTATTSFGKGLAVAALALACTAVGAGVGAAERAPATLPDLTAQVPAQVSVRGEAGRFRLGFASAADNVGDGALIVDGRRRRANARRLRATQVVRHSDGSLSRHRVGAPLRYVRSADHSHWHLLRFMRYTLRDPATGMLVARDRKTGFCLGDRYETDPDVRLPAEPRRPLYNGSCGKGRPSIRRLREGISAGFGDDYDAYLEGQSIDISRVPDGRYLLVHRVNPDRTLRELDLDNNSSSALIELTRGAEGQPRVRVLARCAGSDRCR